jgi:hypothetical protein
MFHSTFLRDDDVPDCAWDPHMVVVDINVFHARVCNHYFNFQSGGIARLCKHPAAG